MLFLTGNKSQTTILQPSQAPQPCVRDRMPDDLLFSPFFVSDPIDFEKKREEKINWLKLIDPGVCIDGFSITLAVILLHTLQYVTIHFY